LLTHVAFAQQPAAEIDRQIPSLIETYKALHQHPELSHHETWTAASPMRCENSALRSSST
jgi:hippurate hydrolase